MARAHPDIPGLVDWQPLARGGFSTVWQARQESLDRQVAVKVDHRPLNEDKERRRFLREAGAAGRLSGHPGIVTVHDAGILADGRPYLVMDLCPGGSLTLWLKPSGRQSERRVRDVGVRIADALAAAHSRGVLHRDVKPANILIDAYDNPGLADFGLAALPEPGVDLSVTLEGMTPAYAPKEVFYRQPPTEFGDVYSLAATLYALMDGKPPRWPDSGTPSLPELLELQREPVERLPQVDDDFMDVLLGALDDEPESRPTAAEFRDQLVAVTFTKPATPPVEELAADGGAVASSEEVVAESARSTGSAPSRTGGRRRGAAVLVAVGVVLVVMVATMFRWGADGDAVTGLPSSSPLIPASTTPSPSGRAAPSPSTESPTVPAAPDGFIDCSELFGGDSYCVDPEEPECWDDAFSYRDIPTVASMRDCDDFHSDQTYAAGKLPVPVNTKSAFEARKEVKELCTEENLEKVLKSGRKLKDWQLQPLPPQVQIVGDSLFRCLVGVGGASKPLDLKVPPK